MVSDAKWSLSSDDLVKIVLQSLRNVAELMGASVFLAIGTGSGKFVHASGYFKNLYEQGNLKPSLSDVNLIQETIESCARAPDENDSSYGGSKEAPSRKRHRGSAIGNRKSLKSDVVIVQNRRKAEVPLAAMVKSPFHRSKGERSIFKPPLPHRYTKKGWGRDNV